MHIYIYICRSERTFSRDRSRAFLFGCPRVMASAANECEKYQPELVYREVGREFHGQSGLDITHIYIDFYR